MKYMKYMKIINFAIEIENVCNLKNINIIPFFATVKFILHSYESN